MDVNGELEFFLWRQLVFLPIVKLSTPLLLVFQSCHFIFYSINHGFHYKGTHKHILAVQQQNTMKLLSQTHL